MQDIFPSLNKYFCKLLNIKYFFIISIYTIKNTIKKNKKLEEKKMSYNKKPTIKDVKYKIYSQVLTNSYISR